MALTLEDGTGVAAANSFVSVAEADTYCADRGLTAWAALSNPSKEAALINATEFISGAFTWVGIRKTTTQALAWPRGARNSYERIPNGVPVQVKSAVARVANLVATESAALFSAVSGGDLLQSVQAGSVAVTFAQSAAMVAASGRASMPWLNDLLAGLITAGPDNPSDGNGFGMASIVRT